jgi:hypothetical protein
MKTLKRLSILSILTIIIITAAIRISHSNQNKTVVPLSATITVQNQDDALKSLATKSAGDLKVVLFLKDLTSGDIAPLGDKKLQINGSKGTISSSLYYNIDKYKFYIARQKVNGKTCSLDNSPSFTLSKLKKNNHQLNYSCRKSNSAVM